MWFAAVGVGAWLLQQRSLCACCCMILAAEVAAAGPSMAAWPCCAVLDLRWRLDSHCARFLNTHLLLLLLHLCASVSRYAFLCIRRVVQDRTYLGVLEAPGPQLAAWVRSAAFSAQMASLFPGGTAAEQPPASCETLTQQQCGEAFGAVQRFEASHNLVLQNMGLAYLQQRTGLISGLLEKGAALGLKDEVVHDGVLLLDRTASAATQVRAKNKAACLQGRFVWHVSQRFINQVWHQQQAWLAMLLAARALACSGPLAVTHHALTLCA